MHVDGMEVAPGALDPVGLGNARAATGEIEDLGNLELKGLRRPVAAFNVVQSTSAAEARPNLTVVARGTGPN